MTRIFISYSHDDDAHGKAVLDFANALRADGFDSWIDQFTADPDEGWARWMNDQLQAADFVLVVPSPLYRLKWDGKAPAGSGRGVGWEAHILRNRMYTAYGRAKGIRPVLVGNADEASIPEELATVTCFHPVRHRDALLRYLHKVPPIAPVPVGTALPPAPPAWSGATPPKFTPRTELERWLLLRFSGSELHRLPNYLDNGDAVRTLLPSAYAPPREIASSLVETLIAQKRLDPQWWALLRDQRDRCLDEIEVLEAQWK